MGTGNNNEDDCVLTMTGIGKSFPGVRALQQVNFKLRRGEIHALMGENGAGKSTLIKVLTGVYTLDEGNVMFEGSPIHITSPLEAQRHGISTVYQEINLCPNLSVAENLFLGREIRTLGLINWRKMHNKAAELLQKLNIPAVPTAQLDNYSVAIQQMIAIARAVSINCKVLILDEPTSSLDDDEVNKLFALMRQLKEQGVGIIFVTHFIEQVYEICDRITVLRNGELVGEYKIENLSRLQLVVEMIGKDIKELGNLKAEKKEWNEGEVPLVEVQDFSSGVSRISPFDLKIREGEVVGFSGLLGSGRSEVVRSIYGADKAI
ncbi:MAG: sugar ABC transporter ATP-binding protein, partial [Treponema sp.]|nr:sugar ABC transporter ATP-binding protein [Treponema sp.]